MSLLARHARDDVKQVYQPRAQALFETTAEVLDRLALLPMNGLAEEP